MTRLTQEQWRALIQEQTASGKTATEFCAERGISDKYFSTRKKQLLGSPDTRKFIPITAKPIENQSVQILTSACQVRLPANISAQWLADLLKALA